MVDGKGFLERERRNALKPSVQSPRNEEGAVYAKSDKSLENNACPDESTLSGNDKH